MNNKALISLSFLILCGVSACSTSSQQPKQVAKNSANNSASSSSIRPNNNTSAAYKRQLAAQQKEQHRLAYNYTWQKQQALKKKKNVSSLTTAQARQRWQQQQKRLLNQERGRLAKRTQANHARQLQQKAQHRRNLQANKFAREQRALAKEYAAQQMRIKAAAQQNLGPAQRYAAEQMRKQAARQRAAQQNRGRAQQYAAQQMRKQQDQQRAARQYAAQQMRKQSRRYTPQQNRHQTQQYAALQNRQQPQQYTAPQNWQQPQQYASLQNRQPVQQLASRQQNQQAQYLAMLKPRGNTPPRTTPQNNGIAGLSPEEMRVIGDKIFRNESGGDIDKLVHWNVGENFASMGIGHFTWYPAGRRNRYGNTFPGLLDHLKSNGVQLPVWVQKARYSGAPWRTKGELKQAKNSRRVQEFQNLLYQTRDLQASYIFERAKRAMPRLVKTTPPHLRPLVAQNLNAVANTRGGWYALIDYVNFKGEGLRRNGGYKGQNWGLLQVLENMRPSEPGQMALNNFADSAIQILERRIRNSNPSKGESRWMRGWAVRCNTYRQPFVI